MLEPGGQVQLALAVLADGFADQLERLPQSIDDLAQVRDAGSGWPTRCPRSTRHWPSVTPYGRASGEHIGQVVAIAGDMNWDGEHIDGMSKADARLLTRLSSQPGEP